MIKFGNLKGIINVITAFAKQHSPEILVGLGISGMVTSTVLAVRATPKAEMKIAKAITDKNEELFAEAVANQQENYSPVNRLKKGDVIKLCWKDYMPAAITGVASVVCIIGGTHINLRRNAALVTAVKLSEVTIKDLQEYKKKVVETIGEEKSDEIQDKVDMEAAERSYRALDMSTQVISGDGPVLYFDKIGGQWFRSDKETIREAINSLNYQMTQERYVSLNDFYDKLGLRSTVAGEALGWDIDQGLIDIRFSSDLMPDGTPVGIVSTRLGPRSNYGSLH